MDGFNGMSNHLCHVMPAIHEYLEKLLFVQVKGFVSKFLKWNAKIEGFTSVWKWKNNDKMNISCL